MLAPPVGDLDEGPRHRFPGLWLHGARDDSCDIHESWASHAQMIVSDGVPQFVELNPRPAGGLLWQTAGLRLGTDHFEAVVSLHVRDRIEDKAPVAKATGQFPIYAEEVCRFERLVAVDSALRVPVVCDIRSAIPPDGLNVERLDRENY